MKERFRRIAKAASDACSTWQAFTLNATVMLILLGLGPLLSWSTLWQAVVSTPSNLVGYLLLFLIMNTQGRDTLEMRLKIDELILSSQARNHLLTLEDLSEDQLRELQDDMKARAAPD